TYLLTYSPKVLKFNFCPFGSRWGLYDLNLYFPIRGLELLKFSLQLPFFDRIGTNSDRGSIFEYIVRQLFDSISTDGTREQDSRASFFHMDGIVMKIIGPVGK